MDQRKRLGGLGEAFAAEILALDGYDIMERNYTCRYGEIDIIAEKEEELFFVEVKTRRGDAFGDPALSITPAKRLHMRRAASNYLSEHSGHHRFFSFLVVEIGVHTIENAF